MCRTLSQPASVDLATLLPSPLALSDVVEYPLNGLGVGIPLADITRINISAMETRTFQATIVVRNAH